MPRARRYKSRCYIFRRSNKIATARIPKIEPREIRIALKDFVALADDKLKASYEKASFNIAKARADIRARLQKAEQQYTATAPSRGRKMFRVNNNVVELTLPFSIDGRNVIYIPSERFADALKHLGVSIEQGELDREIETAATTKPNRASAKAPRKPRSDAGTGWSPERRARFRASIAARKAGKKK